jgi:hypothetical protein
MKIRGSAASGPIVELKGGTFVKHAAAIDRKWGSARNGFDKANPLPSAAIRCAHNEMVMKRTA